MESSLTCEICFDEYNSKEHRPKSLPCGHSICASCVEDNFRTKDGKMDCPFCRSPCGTGVKTLDDFPTFPLLNLLEEFEQKSPCKTLSPKEKEKDILQQKKQNGSESTEAFISYCNGHLQSLLRAKEEQESVIQSIRLGKTKLLEKLQWKLEKFEEEEKEATLIKQWLDDIIAEGNDIMMRLEAIQDCLVSAYSMSGINMALEDIQRYYTASQEWVTSRVKRILYEITQWKEVLLHTGASNVSVITYESFESSRLSDLDSFPTPEGCMSDPWIDLYSPEHIKISSASDLHCSSTTVTPKPVEISCASDLHCSSPTLIPKPVEISSVSDLHCTKPTVTPKPVEISSPSDLHCTKPTVTPKPVEISSPSDLHCTKPTVAPKPVEISSVSNLYYSKATVTL